MERFFVHVLPGGELKIFAVKTSFSFGSVLLVLGAVGYGVVGQSILSILSDSCSQRLALPEEAGSPPDERRTLHDAGVEMTPARLQSALRAIEVEMTTPRRAEDPDRF